MITKTIIDVIGQTPIIELSSLASNDSTVKVFGKLEAVNPASSVKDRSALQLIAAAEQQGLLKPGYTIVESTSGNMGHALAMICAVKKYKLICILDPKTPQSNITLIKAFGGNVEIMTEKDEMGGYQQNRIRLARKIANETPDCLNLDQYNNNAAIDAHYLTTGPEIYQQLQGKVDYLVGCVSTGSHLSGTAKYLKEQNPNIKIVGVEPKGSVIFGGEFSPFLQNGTGLSFTPGNYRSDLVDIEVRVSDEQAFSMCHKMAKAEGLLLGGSSGSVLYAAKQLVAELKQPANIILILADGGLKYLNTLYNPEWLAENNLTLTR